MTHSENATKLVENFEGLELCAYQDQRGIWTIGYGHTAGVKPGDTCTQAQAQAWLDADLKRADDAVNHYVRVDLTQNQFDALVSFTYNVGAGNLETSTLLRLLNEGNKQGAAQQFTEWIHAGNKVSAGLVRRRFAEQALFLEA